MKLYAIWYDALLDGVTASPDYASEAHRKGAWVVPFLVHGHKEGDPVPMDKVPRPDNEPAHRIADHLEARTPLGYHTVPIIQPEEEER